MALAECATVKGWNKLLKLLLKKRVGSCGTMVKIILSYEESMGYGKTRIDWRV